MDFTLCFLRLLKNVFEKETSLKLFHLQITSSAIENLFSTVRTFLSKKPPLTDNLHSKCLPPPTFSHFIPTTIQATDNGHYSITL